MGCFPKLADIPETVAEFVRRAVELPEGTAAVHASPRTGEPPPDALPYGLVWRSDTENDMIRAFARVVRDLGPLSS
ncbi:hypothetical protein ACQEVF_46095 [Nonomuraea polychroma]|uniref:hypothetical protein n=1 Tax=Nonomuraea polychroma TaxID=46176 RepID=UPI003D926CAB